MSHGSDHRGSVGKLHDQVAIVTGAGSIGPGWGNGKAAAVLYAREGARVVAVDINGEAAEETRDIIRGEGGTCETVEADVSNAEHVAAVVDTCLSAFGRVDVLHNNVGIFEVGGAVELSQTQWDRVIKTNLDSLYLMCRSVLPIMERQGGGAIVHIGSISAMRNLGLPLLAYATTKAAVVGFSRSVAMQYGPHNIRSNVVIPGIIDTPVLAKAGDAAYARDAGRSVEATRKARAGIIPIRRFGTAWDVARACLFLVSKDAAYITGAELLVDGGLAAMAPTLSAGGA